MSPGKSWEGLCEDAIMHQKVSLEFQLRSYLARYAVDAPFDMINTLEKCCWGFFRLADMIGRCQISF